MGNRVAAVLLHDHVESFLELEGVLGDLAVEAYSAMNCSQTQALIVKHQPALVFVDLNIWRQFYTTLMGMAAHADQTFNVIVVGSMPEIEKYVTTIEQGAFSFVAPPFTHEVVGLVVQTAVSDASERQQELTGVPSLRATGAA